MTARKTSGNGVNERCATFVIMVKAGKDREPVRQDVISTIGNIDDQSDDGPGSGIWCSESGRVIARVWPENALRVVRQGLNVFAGLPVRVNGRTVGHYSEIDLDSAGHGVIRQDPYGLHPLYIGSARGITLVANRPHLVAAVLQRLTGERPRRDRRFAAWLAFSGYPIGDRTGYERVRCVPFGANVQINRHFRVRLPAARPPWLAGETGSAGAWTDRIESELIANLRGAIAAMGHTPRLQLTGGRDSRLMLALTLRAGLLHDVEIVTLGDADAPDATVAKELTRRLGVGHTQLTWTDGVVVCRQLCPHVGTVAGAVSCVDSSISLATDGRMTLSGLTGEMLRTNWPNRTGYNDERSVVNGFLSMPLGKADLLERDACFGAVTEGIRSLLAPRARGARPEDLFDAYYVQHRLRRWLGSRPQRFADEFFPLYYPPGVEMAFRMGWRARASGRFHNTIIERAGRWLCEPLYYKPGGFYKPEEVPEARRKSWRKRVAGRFRDTIAGGIRRLNYEPSGFYEPAVKKWLDDAFSNRRPLSTRTNSVPPDQSVTPRQRAYRELIAARDDNPIFEIVNRDRLIAAVDALQNLAGPAAREVHGAMTGVIWLGRLEEEF